MSRCFPFPPPNYRKGEQILTESIKLQKERDTSKEKRKEKRRDKKEKREGSKGRNENSKDSERAHKKQKHNEANELHMDAYQIAAAKKIELHTKDVLSEQLESSGLTEEHGLPCLTPEPCESSESIQTSLKGRKLETVSKQGSTIIRFKLPLQRHKDLKSTVIISEEPCFSGRAISTYQEPVSTKVEEPCFSGRVAETPIEMQLGESGKSHKRRRDKERVFRDLIMNWKPAPCPVGNDSVEDLGWLLDNSRRNCANSEAKSCSGGEEVRHGTATKSSSSVKDMSYGIATCSFQPSARYLPELEMFQLPYVIPF